jgi:hypothetical protein
MTKKIELTKGLFALVDDEDYDILNNYKWHITENKNKLTKYASRRQYPENKMIKMHRQIMGAIDPKIHIDHIDGNGLNNCKSNLRICTLSENNRNITKRKNCTSKYKGVHYSKRDDLYTAYINCNKKRTYIGWFKNEIEAAKAYNKSALELFGEFAKLNIIEE